MESALVGQRQQEGGGEPDEAGRAGEDDVGIGGVVGEHFAAGAAGRHDGGVRGLLVGLRLAECHNSGDGAVAFDQGAAQRGGFGADREPPDRGAEMDTGEDAAMAVAGGRGEAVAPGMEMPPQGRCGSRDQRVVLGREGQAGERFNQPLRAPRRGRWRRAGRPRRCRPRRGFWPRSRPRLPDARAGSASRSPVPGRCAANHS